MTTTLAKAVEKNLLDINNAIFNKFNAYTQADFMTPNNYDAFSKTVTDTFENLTISTNQTSRIKPTLRVLDANANLIFDTNRDPYDNEFKTSEELATTGNNEFRLSLAHINETDILTERRFSTLTGEYETASMKSITYVYNGKSIKAGYLSLSFS